MGSHSHRRARATGLALAAAAGLLLGRPAAAQEWMDGLFGLNELLGERITISGYLDFTSFVRSDDFDFDQDTHFAGNRLTFNLETDIDLLGAQEAFLDEAKLFFILRPRYDFVYLTESDEYGNDAETGGVNDLVISALDGELVRVRFPDTVFPLEVPYRPSGTVRGADRCLNCNLDEGELAIGNTDSFPYYPVREAYLDLKKGDLALRVGKQQVVWGKTDFFRLQDVVNPVDFGIHSFLDGLEDIRIPQLMADAIYNFHDIGPLRDVSLELVWNFDEFLPHGLGQAGEPWANIFGEEIKAFARFHDLFGFGIRHQKRPDWELDNTQFGARLEFIAGPVRASISDYYTFQPLPVFKLVSRFSAANPNPVLDGLGFLGFDGQPLEFCCGQIDLIYPRLNILGASLDYFEEVTQTVWRIETSFTVNEDFVNTRKVDWVDESDVIRWSVGIDRITFFRFLNPTRSFFLSYQIFGTHILDHEGDDRTGFINYENDFITTFFITTNYMQDRLIPTAFVAYQFQADALAGGVSLEYLFSDHLSARIGANFLAGRKHTFDNRPFTANVPGLDPDTENFFGTVREGFGTDRDRDEITVGFRYRF